MNKFFCICIIGALAFACKPMHDLPEGAPETMRPRALKKEMERAQNDFKSLRVRAMGKYNTGSGQQSFRFEARLLKDSLIWIDIADPILGIKVARALVTRDSVSFMNRLTSEYFTGDIAQLQKEFNLNLGFSDLQSILSANLLFDIEEGFELYYRPGLYLFSDFDPGETEDPSAIIGKEQFRQVLVDPAFYKPARQVQEEPAYGKRYNVEYRELEKSGEALVYPRSIYLEYLEGETTELKLDIRKVEKDDPQLNYPFNIPSGYAKMR